MTVTGPKPKVKVVAEVDPKVLKALDEMRGETKLSYFLGIMVRLGYLLCKDSVKQKRRERRP
jgi:hypothetical protein